MSSCKKCGEEYDYGWCKPCQIDNLKGNFTNWTSGNEKIDELIQEMQLKIEEPWDIVFEWIPYNQFSDIKKIGKDDFAIAYSAAIWKNGPLRLYNNFFFLCLNRLKHIIMIKFLYMEYLKIQIQKIISWFFKMEFVANAVNNVQI